MRISLFFIFIVLAFNSYAQVGDILINEFMASNNETSIPGHPDNDDWIELRNTTSSPIDISGFYITDKLSESMKFQLPIAPGSVIVPANGYLVLICSDNPSLGANHITLGLSASGEEIGLYAANGSTLIDAVIFGAQRGDISMGRHPVNTSQWKYLKHPTPGGENSTINTYDELLPSPVFSHTAGVYTSDFSLSLSTTVPGATIYYTLDGSDPNPDNVGGSTFMYKNYVGGSSLSETMDSYIYNSPILITDRSNDANRVSVKSTSPTDLSTYLPNSPVTKGTVVKAIAVIPGGLPETSVNTYFVFPSVNKYSFPVVSVSMDEKKMFDFDSGFYTWGANYDPNEPCGKGNYYEDWRPSGHFEYFVNNSKVIDREVVYRIHGGCSRFFPRKTLRVLGGSALDYPIFNSTPQRNHRNIILRNGGQNWDSNFIKDAVNHDIMQGLRFGKQEVTPSVIFVNGEYWGLHDIRERIDHHYLNTLYGVNKDSVDMIEVGGGFAAGEGDMVAFNSMMNFVQNNSFVNTANYDSLANLIDMNSFIDYYIAQTYIANADWPNSNTRFWRKKINQFNPNITGPEDGRWRWILFDTDMTTYDFVNTLGTLSYDTQDYTAIFRKLKDNTKFLGDFGIRYADLLNTSFLSSRTSAIVDDYKVRYSGEIEEHMNRWQKPTVSTWESLINSQKSFFNNRPSYQRNFLMEFLGLDTQRNLTVNVSDSNHGYIKVNTIDILPATPGVSENPYPWTGIYFEGQSLSLIANSKKGGKFLHWLKGVSIYSTEISIEVNLTEDQIYTAVFEEDILSADPFPVAKVLNECGFEFKEWSASSAVGSHPSNMSFVYFNPVGEREDPDHILEDTLGGFTSGIFNHTNRSRVNGLGAAGVSFINTGGPAEHDGYPFGKLGGIILALNTTGQDSIFVSWTGGTVLPNIRTYAIRLQYRRGDKLDFQDVIDQDGNPFEYVRNATQGHSQVFENIKLPDEISNEPYVQLLWNYYLKESGTSGARAQLKVDDIKVFTKAFYGKEVNQTGIISEYGVIESKATVSPVEMTDYKASKYIMLEPGFNTTTDAVFKAEINTCEE